MHKAAKPVIRYGGTRIRPEMAKRTCTVMLWDDYKQVLAELGSGSVSGGIAFLVSQHLRKAAPRSRTA